MSAQTPSDEDQLDGIYQFNSLVFLGCALALGFSALRMAVDPAGFINVWSGWARSAFLLFTPVALIIAMWKTLQFKNRGHRLWVREGFIYRMHTTAITVSWVATMLVLTIIPELLEDSSLGPKFYTRLFTAIMFGAYGSTYLVLSLSNKNSDNDFGSTGAI